MGYNMKKVLIVCISESLSVPFWFATALADTFKLAKDNNVDLEILYSLSGTSAKQQVVSDFLERDYDSIFFLNPSLQWRAEDFIKTVTSEHPVVAAVTSSPISAAGIHFNVSLKSMDTMPVLANSVKFDFINIDKSVFTSLQNIVKTISLPDKDGTFVQTPVYFADQLDDYGIKDEEYAFAEYLEKAGIDIVIDPSIILFTHILSPHASALGEAITRQLAADGFKEVAEDTPNKN